MEVILMSEALVSKPIYYQDIETSGFKVMLLLTPSRWNSQMEYMIQEYGLNSPDSVEQKFKFEISSRI